MRAWTPARVADAAGARLLGDRGGAREGPTRAAIDSRTLEGGELFVGLGGARTDGGTHARDALAAGAWGVLVAPPHAAALAFEGIVLEHDDPLRGLQALARAWRAELGCGAARVVAITGSTGKTSTKDILAALLRPHLRTASSAENHNTEIGLPLAVLAAPADTQALVLEMAMRGPGQIAELTEIARPDVGAIVNVGPVHLELLGSLEAIAAAKAELIAGLAPGATVVIPAREPLLHAHLREDVRVVSFGEGGDVQLVRADGAGEVQIRAGGHTLQLWPSFHERHNLINLLAAVACARAVGVEPEGSLEVGFSAMRGERLQTDAGIVLINDCYNANPMSMRAAIDELAAAAPGRRVAVLGDMLELGPQAPELHRQLGAHAARRGVDLLVTVGPLAENMLAAFAGEARAVADADAAAEALGELLRSGDTVLVKGSRGVALERVAEALGARAQEGRPSAPASEAAPAAGARRR